MFQEPPDGPSEQDLPQLCFLLLDGSVLGCGFRGVFVYAILKTVNGFVRDKE